MRNSLEYDHYIRGTVIGMSTDAAGTWEVLIEDDCGRKYWFRDLPTPDGESYEQYWQGMADRAVVVRDYRRLSVEVLDEP